MKKFLLILILPLVLGCPKLGGLTKKETGSSNKQDTQTLSEIQPGENTYGVVAGVLEWSDRDFPPFEKRNRKDKEFYEILKSKGADKNVKLLIDGEASLKNIKSQVEKALNEAPGGSIFMFYFAGHGVKDDNSSLVYFANSDIKGSDYKNSGFSVEWLGDIIAKKFKGRLVWLMADCCYSGGLLDQAGKINAAGKNVIAVTSASSCNISTGNWTFSQTIIDCFNGLPLADHNSDGFVSLKETEEELRSSMKFREHQLSGYNIKDVDENAAISITNGTFPVKNSSAFPVGSYCYAFKGGDWETVRIIDSKNNKLVCEFYDYSDKSSENISESELKPAYFVTHKKGDKVKVEWEGKWYPAKIIDTDNDFYLIKYDGYDDTWNEWAAYERIKSGSEKSARVEWQGTWYPAVVHEETGSKYFISYAGYAYTWDEWVTGSRIKF